MTEKDIKSSADSRKAKRKRKWLPSSMYPPESPDIYGNHFKTLNLYRKDLGNVNQDPKRRMKSTIWHFQCGTMALRRNEIDCHRDSLTPPVQYIDMICDPPTCHWVPYSTLD
ncbi:hypothetical protein TNCV_4553911 [Trichonephila clavipes]|nr:hypothetical protein TNCV_4553911 [Trichonephila clavipes]